MAVDLGQVTKTTSKAGCSLWRRKNFDSQGKSKFCGIKSGWNRDRLCVSSNSNAAGTCTNGTFSEARTANFKTAKGQVVIVGKTANTSVSIVLAGDSTKNLAINACGTGVLHAAKGDTLPDTFTVNGSSYTLASLPDAGKGPVCKKSATGAYTTYTPSTWASGGN